ncbi:MAG: hypothetical protein DRP86_07290 [Candidatus Neomarinimicrobiota bacterium]|nr:hypothetical protein [Candidatus Neomarinimicrobiota bacterium]RKY47784.1 MAG: hypothetical protein DRP86_07290 [Candidatus Neomarinimicrobiota bacterium]
MQIAQMEMLAIVITSIATFVTIILVFYFEYRKKRLLSEQIIKFLEQGGKASEISALIPKPNYIRRGYLFISLGVTLGIALWLNTGIISASWGLILAGLGLAYILAEKHTKS